MKFSKITYGVNYQTIEKIIETLDELEAKATIQEQGINLLENDVESIDWEMIDDTTLETNTDTYERGFGSEYKQVLVHLSIPSSNQGNSIGCHYFVNGMAYATDTTPLVIAENEGEQYDIEFLATVRGNTLNIQRTFINSAIGDADALADTKIAQTKPYDFSDSITSIKIQMRSDNLVGFPAGTKIKTFIKKI